MRIVEETCRLGRQPKKGEREREREREREKYGGRINEF
jgi:hypothetical protein